MNMATSYYNVSLHHLADHLIYLSSSSSFWFSLNSSYDHEFHLSKQLGMSPQDYEYLPMALDLANIHKRWGFSMKLMKWKVFLEGHLFSTINCDATFAVDTKKMDIDAFFQGESPKKRNNITFIRIGVLHANSPRKIEMQKDSDGQTIVTPPQLNELRIKQQAFRHCVEQLKWNYLLEKEDEGDKDDNDENNNNVDNENDNDNTDDDVLINASSTTTSNNEGKYNTITPGGDNNMSKFNMAKSYPHLSRALGMGEDGFDPINPSIQKSMHSLLSEINNLLNTKYQLDVSGLSNKRISYV